MKHKESDLQIRCLKWFRYQYPAYAPLLYHPKNKRNGNRRQGAIAKAEGVQPGVADLILQVPSIVGDELTQGTYAFNKTNRLCHSLAIELKTKTGRQSKEQRRWQRYFEAAGGKYIVIRSYEEFTAQLTTYLDTVLPRIHDDINSTHADIQSEADEAARQQFQKILHP